jgi:hypothetical protein
VSATGLVPASRAAGGSCRRREHSARSLEDARHHRAGLPCQIDIIDIIGQACSRTQASGTPRRRGGHSKPPHKRAISLYVSFVRRFAVTDFA